MANLRERDILERFEEKRQKFTVTSTPQQPLPYVAQIIMNIIVNPNKAADEIIEKMSSFDVYSLELALKNTPYREFFKNYNIWNRYRKKVNYYQVKFQLPKKYSPRWAYFTENALQELDLGNMILFINPNTNKTLGIKIKFTRYFDRVITITDETSDVPVPVNIVSPTDINIPFGKLTWVTTVTNRNAYDIAGQIVYNLFATGYRINLSNRGKNYNIGKCITCQQKATLREADEPNRVFCGEACQKEYYD